MAANSNGKTVGALAAILAVGAALRIWGLGFGLPHIAARPDEEVVVRIALGFFSGDYNPHMFLWPSLFFYIAHAVARLGYAMSWILGEHRDTAAFVSSLLEDPSWFYVSLRLVSAASGVMTVALVYRFAREVFDRAAAMLAALFLALAYLHVRDSHFGVLDVTLVLLILLSVRASWHAAHTDAARGWFVWAGIWAGLATSVKYNAAALGIVAVFVAVMRMQRHADDTPRTVAAHVAIFSLVFACLFVAGTPYAVLDAPAFAAGLREQGRHFAEGHTLRIGNGWWYHLTFSLRHGLGLPLLAAALGGMIAAMLAAPRRAISLAAFPLVYFAIIGMGQTAFVRYVLPLVPFLCIFAAFGVTRFVDAVVRPRAAQWTTPALAGAAALLILPSALNVVRFNRIVSRVDTRVVAADWLRSHMEPGAVLYGSGESYSQPRLAWPPSKRDYLVVEFDAGRHRFTTPGAGLPDWIVTPGESSPRLYSRTPYQVTALLAKHYDLVQEFTALRGDERESWFDRQDAFFVPYSDLRFRERPGPDLRIYHRTR